MTSTSTRLAAVLTFAVVALTACGGGTSSSPDADAPSSTTPASTAPTTPSASATPDPAYHRPKVGQCRRLTAKDVPLPTNSDPAVPCARPHTARTFKVATVPHDVSLSVKRQQKLLTLVGRVCGPAWTKAVGGTGTQHGMSILSWAWFTPTKAERRHGARWIRCDLIAQAGAHLVRLPSGNHPVIGTTIPNQYQLCITSRGAKTGCGFPHAYRISGTFQAPKKLAYPGHQGLQRLAEGRCPSLVSTSSWYWFGPSRSTWKAGGRTIECYTQTTT